jgi:hypothetical protein
VTVPTGGRSSGRSRPSSPPTAPSPAAQNSRSGPPAACRAARSASSSLTPWVTTSLSATLPSHVPPGRRPHRNCCLLRAGPLGPATSGVRYIPEKRNRAQWQLSRRTRPQNGPVMGGRTGAIRMPHERPSPLDSGVEHPLGHRRSRVVCRRFGQMPVRISLPPKEATAFVRAPHSGR